jgi:hypothetical protein
MPDRIPDEAAVRYLITVCKDPLEKRSSDLPNPTLDLAPAPGVAG